MFLSFVCFDLSSPTKFCSKKNHRNLSSIFWVWRILLKNPEKNSLMIHVKNVPFETGIHFRNFKMRNWCNKIEVLNDVLSEQRMIFVSAHYNCAVKIMIDQSLWHSIINSCLSVDHMGYSTTCVEVVSKTRVCRLMLSTCTL